MRTSESIDNVATALCKAQAAMLPLIKDSENPFFKSKYADLHAVTAACYPALQANGIAVIQSNRREDGALVVVTRLLHVSAQWIETECVVPAKAVDAQAYGSAYTYGRRYGLQAAVGLAPEDDDGHAAVERKQPAAAKPAAKPAPKVTPQEALAKQLSEDPGKPWFELKPFTKGQFAGKELSDVTTHPESVEALQSMLDYIDSYTLDFPLAIERLTKAINAAKSL